MKRFTTLLAFLFSLSSCYHVYYTPNTANASLLTQKGETKFGVLYTEGNESEFAGGEVHFATAINNKVAVMVNGLSVSREDDVMDYQGNGTSKEKGRGSYVEFAGGIFKSVKDRGRWVGEVYGGVGLGSAKNDYSYNDRSKVNSTKLFIQPAGGYKSKYFEFALVPKVSYVHWKVKENRVVNEYNNDHKQVLAAIHNKPSFFAFEPALVLRGGSENVKAQLGLSFSYSNWSADGGISYYDAPVEDLVASLGITFTINPKKPK